MVGPVATEDDLLTSRTVDNCIDSCVNTRDGYNLIDIDFLIAADTRIALVTLAASCASVSLYSWDSLRSSRAFLSRCTSGSRIALVALLSLGSRRARNSLLTLRACRTSVTFGAIRSVDTGNALRALWPPIALELLHHARLDLTGAGDDVLLCRVCPAAEGEE